MKNLKSILYLLLFSFAFVACENNDFDPVEVNYKDPKQVKIVFTDQNNGEIVVEDGGQASFELSITEALPYDAEITLRVTSSDGSLETTAGVNEVSYDETIMLPAGQKSTAINLSFVDDNLNDTYEVYTLEVANFKTSESLKDYFVISSSLESEKYRKVIVFDDMPDEIVTTVPGDVSIELNWRDASRDMDLYIFRGFSLTRAALIDFSEGFSTREEITLPAGEADNLLGVYVNQYQFTADVDANIVFKFPDETERTYSYTVSQPQFVFSLVKITQGEQVVYAINRL